MDEETSLDASGLVVSILISANFFVIYNFSFMFFDSRNYGFSFFDEIAYIFLLNFIIFLACTIYAWILMKNACLWKSCMFVATPYVLGFLQLLVFGWFFGLT